MKIILISYLFLTSCGIVSYKAYPDGTTTAWGIRIGTDEVIKNFQATTTKEAHNVSIDSINSEQTKGLSETNQALGTIIGTALRVYTLKP